MVIFFYVYLAVATLEMLLVTNIIPMTVGAYKVAATSASSDTPAPISHSSSPLTPRQLCLLSSLLLLTSAP